MTTTSKIGSETASKTRALSVRSVGGGHVRLAGGVRAGHWVFVSGMTPENLGDAALPLSGEPAWLTQAKSVWEGVATVLAEGQSEVGRIARSDQFFSDWRAVPFFHQARRAACGSYVAPSTSILQPATLVPGADMMTDMIAVASDGPRVEPISPDGLDLPATSSFVPVARVGEMVFVAGFLAASGVGDLDGVAAAAKVPEGHLWKGNRITLEAGYVIREKLVPALKSVGLTLADVVKANVFLRDIEDVPAFNQVWTAAFGGKAPATSITPTSKPGFAIEDSRIEINLVAFTNPAKVTRVEGRPGMVPAGLPLAVRAGDLLLFSGLVAADDKGLIESARVAERDRHTQSSVQAQVWHLIDAAEAVCQQHGTSLRNAARILQVHTDLAEFLPAAQVWQQRFPDMALPISAARVNAPLTVPGCSVQMDLWVYAP